MPITMPESRTVWVLDYGAGNIRSVINAIQFLGFTPKFVQTVEELRNAPRLLFPGVGAFGSAMESLEANGFAQPLREYIRAGNPFFGICIGMQVLFDSSEESPNVQGLSIIPTAVCKFRFDDQAQPPSVPHMGWNGLVVRQRTTITPEQTDEKFYFVHSYMALPEPANADWVATTTNYGSREFISSVSKGRAMGTQFHPEKSGVAGLNLIRRYLEAESYLDPVPVAEPRPGASTQLAKRVIACLDVRANDNGDLVVTKGDQYDVREKDGAGDVRNLGKPVELAERYYLEGADEVTFLNITSFREMPMKDLPMLEVLRQTSEKVFVPLTIGGGIRDITDPDGSFHSAVSVAAEYFRSGADKVSIGSDAVYAAEDYYKNGCKPTGKTAIEAISKAYGCQAVVISVDPKRVYVASAADAPGKHVIQTQYPGPNDERWCWYQCTVKGGREARDLDAHALGVACEALGAGEILLNCMDKDGTNSGFDLEFVRDIKAAVTIPVIASSGAGKPEHFVDVFQQCEADAALAAGIFHRREVPISAVKSCLRANDIPCRDT